MATGIAIPFQANGRGRLLLVSGEDQLRKIILLNLMNLESDNPFQQDIGLGGEMIFAVQSNELKGELRRRVNAFFRRLQLQNRARLAKPPVFEERPESQELEMIISYINLEDNKPSDLAITFTPGKPMKAISRAFEVLNTSKLPGS